LTQDTDTGAIKERTVDPLDCYVPPRIDEPYIPPHALDAASQGYAGRSTTGGSPSRRAPRSTRQLAHDRAIGAFPYA